MPVTLAHPAAILPLRRLGLPTSALVAGSVAPDVPLFVAQRLGYAVTHGWAGLVTVDLVVALVLVAIWDHGVRDALVDTSPGPVRARLALRRRLTRRQWLLAPLAAVVGSVTHVGWDAFTHEGRWGVTWVPWLQDELGPLPGSKWAQYLSGVLGTLVVVAAVAATVHRSRPVSHRPPRVLPAVTLPAALVVAAAAGAAAALLRVTDGVHAVACTGVVATIVAVSSALVGVTLAWLVAARSRSAEPGC